MENDGDKTGTTARSATRETVVSAARNHLIAGRKLDMVALAAELGVGRATLYRWTGGREILMREVLESFLYESFARLDRHAARRQLQGKERIAYEFEEMMRLLVASQPVRALLKNEPDVGLRLLTDSSEGGLQGTSIARLVRILDEEKAAGRYKPRIAPRLLALAAVRLVDSYVYGNIIAGIPIDMNVANQVLHGLL
ncbi:QsdR family transcriptional regulator [Noviherbaspirillum galbum]|uniref:QsdR TetR regulatory C-terminal domain-containing protein n=1 Tax=Noviherbaspirillum galbum TaxID=2709383 RepID=A0A6B3SMR8_9BURK|nr:QsdR family transcriptional regulator [Noviherbaspirillum galbum]NEX62150.1 hypothetical protein [Noviherbaspirillum galbum]